MARREGEDSINAAHAGRIFAAMRQLLEEIPKEIAAPPDVHFKHYGVQPWAPSYISKSDFLQVNILTSVTTSGLSLGARILTPLQGINYMAENLDGVSPNTLTTRIFPLTEGFLESIAVSNIGGGLADGACYVSLALQFGSAQNTPPHTVLAQGFVTNDLSISWPPSVVRAFGDTGAQPFTTPLSITVPNPDPGDDWVYTVPAGKTYTLQLGTATFTPGALTTASDVLFIVDDGTNALTVSDTGFTPVASTAASFYLGTLLSANNGPQLNAGWYLDTPIIIGPGYRIRSNTTGIGGTDQWGPIQLGFLE
jgi:hypothetical protein